MTNHTHPSSFPTDQIFTTTALPGISLRVMLDTEGQPWFVARDVALALGYEKPGNVIQQHCKKVNKNHPSPCFRRFGKDSPYSTTPDSRIRRVPPHYAVKAEGCRPLSGLGCGRSPAFPAQAGRYSLISADHTDLGLPDFRNPVDAANAWAAGYANL